MTALPLMLALAAGATVNLTAERLVHDDARKVTTAEGDAELVAQNAAMHAERITWDEGAQAATASGSVVVRLTKKGLMAIVADVVTVRVTGDEVSEVFVYDGVAMRKKNTTPAALLAAKTPEQVRAAGVTTMTMSASHFTRNDDDTWTIDDLGFTPCECDFDRPSWHIATSRTTLDLDAERASLLFPTIYVWKVPVLWFPWLSLPLSDRQTGLLVPRPTFTALNGFQIEQPVFITLGRSADLTLTPGYFAGGTTPFGIRGPRLGTEFRYAPSAGTSGRATFGLLWDLRLQRDPTVPGCDHDHPEACVDANLQPVPVPAFKRRGIRGDFSWQHTQSLGSGWYDRLNLSLLSDGNMVRDFTPDVLAREAAYLRSTATVFHKGDDHLVGLDLVLRQDTSLGYGLFASQGPNPIQRLPALMAMLPSRQLVGPLTFSVRAETVRLAPLLARATSLDAFDRLDVMPRLDVGGVAHALSLSAFAAYRQDVWVRERTGELAQRGYPLLGAAAQTEVARTFGSDVRHTISPQVEVRAVPGVLGGPAPVQYDDVDGAVPGTGAAVQAVAQLRQRLQLRGKGDLLRLDLGQSFQLVPTVTTGESFARLGVSAGLARATSTLRYDPLLGRFTRASVSASVDDLRGRGLYVSYEDLLNVGSDRARAPIDLLIGPRIATEGSNQVLALGAHWRLGGVGLRYDLLYLGLGQLHWPQQTVGVSYGPACECWRFEAFGTYRGNAFPDLGASLTITGFGTLGTGG